MSAGKIIFFGTPEAARAHLAALVESGADVVGVVTQEDKPAGRGQKLTPSPVKEYALAKQIPVFQPRSLKSFQIQNEKLSAEKSAAKLAEFLNAAAPIDLFVVVAYGKLLPKALLEFPKRGVVNVHFSLLPRWRGAAPIQRAILAGDKETGVGLMQMAEALDTGPVYATEKLPITSEDDTGTLHDKLVTLGSGLLSNKLPEIISGKITAQPQATTGATHAEKWEREDCVIDWSKSAEEILQRIRAAAPRPGAFSLLNGEQVKIFRAAPQPDQNFPKNSAPGTIVDTNPAELIVAAGNSQYISLLELQFPGKKRLPIVDILKGKNFKVGDRFARD